MGKTSTYESKIPDAKGIISYSEQENAVWRDLYARQSKLLPGRVCEAFLKGIDLLELPGDRVPQLMEVDARLQEVSGFGVEPVPALISPKRFFTLLAGRKFPAATFIRRREDFDYLQEPDVFHEIFGHCPMLTLPAYADYLQAYGETALRLDKSYLWMMQRLFWFGGIRADRDGGGHPHLRRWHRLLRRRDALRGGERQAGTTTFRCADGVPHALPHRHLPDRLLRDRLGPAALRPGDQRPGADHGRGQAPRFPAADLPAQGRTRGGLAALRSGPLS